MYWENCSHLMEVHLYLFFSPVLSSLLNLPLLQQSFSALQQMVLYNFDFVLILDDCRYLFYAKTTNYKIQNWTEELGRQTYRTTYRLLLITWLSILHFRIPFKQFTWLHITHVVSISLFCLFLSCSKNWKTRIFLLLVFLYSILSTFHIGDYLVVYPEMYMRMYWRLQSGWQDGHLQ